MVLRAHEQALKVTVSTMLEYLDNLRRGYEGGFIGEMRRLIAQHRGTEYLGWSHTTGFYYHAKDDSIYRGRQKGRIGKETVDLRDLPGDLIDNPRDYKPRHQSLPSGFQELFLSELTSTK